MLVTTGVIICSIYLGNFVHLLELDKPLYGMASVEPNSQVFFKSYTLNHCGLDTGSTETGTSPSISLEEPPISFAAPLSVNVVQRRFIPVIVVPRALDSVLVLPL